MSNKQVGISTVVKLRRLYLETWSREWPHDDSYIRELWLETRREIRNGTNKVPPPGVWDRCIEAMRENHTFEPVN